MTFKIEDFLFIYKTFEIKAVPSAGWIIRKKKTNCHKVKLQSKCLQTVGINRQLLLK